MRILLIFLIFVGIASLIIEAPRYFENHKIVIINPQEQVVVALGDLKEKRDGLIHALIEKVHEKDTDHLKDTMRMQSELITKLQNSCGK